ncbi:hypothetical protein AVL61_05720 [Kocuria rosea subsp. polaris]|uniref:Uncharacterized protein n=1 Tax=Kocuria rosea subsp. polaris TaxID=136273 RepID=A0A0W8I9U2_KOCRO|nr:hypothetical protein AVL61_05720 [Kocuria polaris]
MPFFVEVVGGGDPGSTRVVLRPDGERSARILPAEARRMRPDRSAEPFRARDFPVHSLYETVVHAESAATTGDARVRPGVS